MHMEPTLRRLDSTPIRLSDSTSLAQCKPTCSVIEHKGVVMTHHYSPHGRQEQWDNAPPQPTANAEPRVRFVTPMDPHQLQQFEEEVAHTLAPPLSEVEQLLSSWDNLDMGSSHPHGQQPYVCI